MRKKLNFYLFFLLLLTSYSSLCFSAENVFYILRYNTPDRMTTTLDTRASLKKNYKKIDILIPQAYNINEFGKVNKEIEPAILNFATKHSMKIMPLVTNTQFSREIAHQFLSDTAAQTKALETLVNICKKNNFYGLQLDFEMISLNDRDALTRFYTLAANELHKNGLVISFAIAPVVTDKSSSLFLKKIYENWEGAYDLNALGKIADFISIMAYNQHGGSTTPGPTASLPWVRETLTYALKYIPSNKISIGIADFSTHWYTGSTKINDVEKITVKMRAISYESAMALVHHHNEKLIWDDQSAVFYMIFLNHWLNEYLFLEDAQSFSAKYNLVQQYKLRGVSVFDLGTEDPGIWKIISPISPT